MTKTEAKALQAKYNMEILRNPITSEAWALGLSSQKYIPELDDLAATSPDSLCPCAVTADYSSPGYTYYRVICPTSWFDLYGWAGKERSHD